MGYLKGKTYTLPLDGQDDDPSLAIGSPNRLANVKH